MSTEAIDVTIRADDTAVAAGMRSASDVVRTAAQQIKSALDSVRQTALGVGNAMRTGFADGFRDGMNEVKQAADQMESNTRRMSAGTSGVTSAFGGLKSMLVGIGIGAVATETVKTIAEFERLRAVLATMEGGEGAGNARFAELKKFSTETPFQLTEVVSAFSKLKSQGLDPSNAALTSYGNTAAAMGKNLDQMVEAVADASMGEFERLKEFGIKAKDAGDKVVFTFQGVSTEVSKSGDAVQQYLQGIGNNQFAGAMERQMNTLGGAFSNVQDTVANFADAVGTGGLGAALRDVMKDFTAASSGSDSFAIQLGDVLGTAVKETWGVIKTLGSVIGEIFNAIGDIVRAVVGDNVSNMEIWQKSINIVKVVFVALAGAIRQAAIIITTAVQAISNAISTFVASARAVANLDFSGAVNRIKEGVDRQRQIFEKGGRDMVANAQNTRAQVVAAWNSTGPKVSPTGPLNTSTGVGGGGGTGAGGRGGGRSRGGGGGGSDSAMSRYEEQLQAQRTALDRQNAANNTFYSLTKEQEAAFWQNILDTQRLSQRDRTAVERKYLEANTAARRDDYDDYITGLRNQLEEFRNNQDERLRITRQIADEMSARYGQDSREYEQAAREVVRIERAKAEQIAQIQESIRQTQQQGALASVDARQQASELEEQLGLISAQQGLQREMEFEQQRYQIKLTALQERMALMESDPDMNPVEYQRLKGEIEAIEREHQLRIGQVRMQSYLEGKQLQLQGIQSLSQSWSSTLGQMMTGQISFANGIKGLWQGLVGAITQALTSMIAKWIVQQLTALLIGKVAGSASAAGQITANAGVAGSAAFASTAAIPIVGPGLAPAAAAAAMAGALSFLPMAAAARGYDIPAGVNPITQLHQKEMVLPAEQAEVIRGMAGQGAAGQAITVNVHALDGKSVQRMFMENKAELTAAIKSAVRDGVR